MSVEKIDNIVFSGDILRIENNDINRFKNPQAINIDWIRSLFEPLIGSICTNSCINTFYGEEGRENSVRWNVYDSLELPLDESSWTSIYRDTSVVSNIVADVIAKKFQNSLWVTFEAPPYLIEALKKLNITYIDFTIHPVRFLPDYFFGIRSNNIEINNRIKSIKLEDSLIKDFARISKSRTVRTFRKDVPKDSIIFLGQLLSDSSLIVENEMASIDTVIEELRKLTVIHDLVYYKAHPHLKNIDEMKKIVQGIPKCQWIDINIYDALGSNQFQYFATLSSGTHVEASYFDKNCRRLLNNPNLFDQDTDDNYTPVYSCYLMRDFWEFVITGKEFDYKSYFPDVTKEALKMTLNMKWGR